MPITTCDSLAALRAEFDAVRKKVTLDEAEDTWDAIAQGIVQLTYLCNNGGCDFPSEMVAGLRSLSRPLNGAFNSERSRLSGAAVELLTALATGLGSSFEPLVSLFVPTLLAMCGRTNKVFTSRAKACILAIVQHTRLPSLLPYLAELANHKSVFPRLMAAEGILACLNCFNPPDLEKETRARVVEDFIKLTACDASADVRRASKEVFKAYKMLMPARVESFVALLTPVIRKYLNIQNGPSGIQAASSSIDQKQTSRPSSRANNNVKHETGQRHASSTSSRPPIHPPTGAPAPSTRQRPAANSLLTGLDLRVPRLRTTSQMQRDPRSIHMNAQPSSTAQRPVVQAHARQAVQHPPLGAARIVPVRSTSTTGGPQRPPPMQIKFNPPRDRVRITDAVRSGGGAQRIPLPPVPVHGHASEQAAVTANSADRPDRTVDKHPQKLPSRHAEPVAPGKLAAVGRKAPEATRSASFAAKEAEGSTSTRQAAVQRSRRPFVKGETSNPSALAPRQHPVGTVQKGTRPLAKRKEILPALVPLPPSPSSSPAEIPLPASPDCVPHHGDLEARDQPVVSTLSASSDATRGQLTSVEACHELENLDSPRTPITTLLSSIQRGFLFTPSSPLSPPQNYLPSLGILAEQRKIVVLANNEFTKGLLPEAPFCMPLEDDPTNGFDRHAFRDLN